MQVSSKALSAGRLLRKRPVIIIQSLVNILVVFKLLIYMYGNWPFALFALRILAFFAVNGHHIEQTGLCDSTPHACA